MKELTVLILFWIFPYNLLGEETASHLFLTLLFLYIIFTKKLKLEVNRTYLFLLMSISVLSIITLFFSVSPIRSLYGVSLAGSALLAFILIQKENEANFIKYSLYAITGLAVLTLIYQGVLRDTRIYGNFGYANTYALVLFMGLVFSEKVKEHKLDFFIKLILMTALIYTGDRTMILLFIGWIIYCAFRYREIHLLLSFVFSVVQYVICVKMGWVLLIIAPIVVPVLYLLYKGLVRLNKLVVTSGVLLAFILISMISTNTVERMKGISFQNASLVERWVSFEDVIKQIPSNPFGMGANSFEYSQYPMKSAFYESKYIHNSILQYLYDYGVIGAVLFMALIVIGFILVMTSRNQNKEMYLIIYISIVLHSLLNFDLVYPTIWMVLVAIVALCSDKSQISLSFKKSRVLLTILGAVTLVLSIHEGMVKLADWGLQKQSKEMPSHLLSIQSKLKIPDDRLYYLNAGIGKLQYDQTSNSTFLLQAEKNLYKAQAINETDPRIKWNLAYILEKQKNDDAAEKLWKQVLMAEKVNPEIYRIYDQFLQEKYEGQKNIENQELAELREIHDRTRNELNSMAKYLPNQLGRTLEITLEK